MVGSKFKSNNATKNNKKIHGWTNQTLIFYGQLNIIDYHKVDGEESRQVKHRIYILI